MEAEKTPVTLLQEMMAKISTTPNYELCPDDINANSKKFTFKLTCAGITVVGSGISKKEAKQNAARLFLEKLNSPISSLTTEDKICEQPSQLSSPQGSISEKILENYIQKLQRLVNLHELEQPLFEDLEAVGPSHDLTHSVSCTICSLKTKGTAKTKRLAKNIAAKKMFEKVETLYKVVKTDSSIHKKLKTDTVLKTEENQERLSSTSMSSSKNITVFQNLLQTIKQCEQDNNNNNLIRVKKEFTNVLKELKIDFNHMLLQSDHDTYMLIIQINTIPEILEMSLANSKPDAELRAINKAVQSLLKLQE